jgi:hypothetical protein
MVLASASSDRDRACRPRNSLDHPNNPTHHQPAEVSRLRVAGGSCRLAGWATGGQRRGGSPAPEEDRCPAVPKSDARDEAGLA